MSLQNIFTPQSIAIIGASAQVGSVGYAITKNLVDNFKGQIFPVNPKSVEILNEKCFASILDLPIIPDLVVIVVPARIVPMVLQQAADKGVKGVVIISAGFREIGGEGVVLEESLKKICVDNNISLIGPNCLGVINPWIKMNASFANSIPPKGNIAFLSQSGAICTAVIDYANTLGLGFSKFVSVGNKALSSEVEMLNYLESDPETEVIAIYAEGLTDASLIIQTMKSITKPVVILKSGRTAAGGGASSSHTGALASEDILYETLFRQAGITRANSIEELFEFMEVLGKYPKSIVKLMIQTSVQDFGSKIIPLIEGCQAKHDGVDKSDTANNGNTEAAASINQPHFLWATKVRPYANFQKLQVAIITNAGGPGVLTTDAVIQNGMELAKVSESSLEKLKLFLPPTANFHNPIDLIGDAPARRYQDALEILTQDENVDAIIVILTPQTTTEIDETAQIISNFTKVSSKPIIASFIGGDKVITGVKILRQNNVVHIDFPENAARAVSVLSEILKVNSEELKNNNTSDCHSEHLSEESHLEVIETPNVSPLSYSDMRTFAPLKTTAIFDNKSKAQAIFDLYKAQGESYIPEVDAKKIFELYNIPTVKSVFCKNVIEVKGLISKKFISNQKLILKIISPDIMHKSDFGGVMANVTLENAVQEFVRMMEVVQHNLPNARLEGVLFSEMVDLSSGVEFILGAKKDPSLGTAIMFGLGGTLVELIHDIAFAFGRLERQDILLLINELKSKKIIEGYRGKSPLDLEAIITTIHGLSNLLADFPNITEVDMNPVLVGYNQSGVTVLDAKIVFSD
jgi:acetate---CoA ligase (ADP-forming)